MPTVFARKTPSALATDAPSVERTIMTPLTSFAAAPEGIRFETQERGESVSLFLRQHVAFLIGPAFMTIVLSMSPILIFPVLFHLVPLPFAVPVRYLIVGTAFWYVMTFGFALMSFLRWFFNIYIVTERRIVDIDFVHLLYKEFSEARLERIQDISYKSGGIFAAFFDYGDVYVQTAGEMPNIEFTGVPRPARIVETISALLEKQKRRK